MSAPVASDRVAWPGVDKQRALGAAFHLTRAVQLLIAIHRQPYGRWHLLPSIGEHMRIARGYLGAIGFEHGARLWTR